MFDGLDGAVKAVRLARGELARRGVNVIGSPEWQRDNVRRLEEPEREADFELGASPEQLARFRNLDNIEPNPALPHNRLQGGESNGSNGNGGGANGNGGSRGPGGMRGRASRINAGRPRGS